MSRTVRDRRARLTFAVLMLALAASLAVPASADFGEIGSNDFRVSFGDPELDDRDPAVAYSPAHDVYLAVWHEVSAVDDEGRIVARLLAGSSGQTVGGEIAPLPSQPCLDGFCPGNPAVAYSAAADRFVVVASLDAVFPGQEANEYEIVAFDVDPVTGATSWVVPMSDAGPLGNPNFDTADPDVACSGATDECLVVWWGDDNVGGLVDDENEIFGQILDATTGIEVGVNDFRISDAGGTGSVVYSARFPAVAYNSGDDEYLVVWSGSDNVGGLVAQELEIFGQRLDAATGAAQGANDFRISDLGGSGNTNYGASRPAVAYAAGLGQYLVVWQGDDNVGGLIDNEIEIFGQRLLASTGAETGANDFRVSDMGSTGNLNYFAASPSVAFGAALGEYLVTWRGDDEVGGLQNDKFEAFGQRLVASTGAEVGDNDFRLSDMGSTGEIQFFANLPEVAYDSQRAQYLVIWHGSDDVGGLAEDEIEVFGQLLGEQELFADGFETGDTSAWSLMVP